MGPRAGMDRCGKSRLPPGFDPRTVQAVASRYTDYSPRSTVAEYLLLIGPFRHSDYYATHHV